MNNGKKTLFGILGFFAGIAAFAVFTAAASVTAAGMLTVLALSESRTTVQPVETAGSLEEESARFLSSFRAGSRVHLSEQALSRLAAAAILDAVHTDPPAGSSEFELLGLRTTAGPGRVRFDAVFTVYPRTFDSGRYTLKPVTAAASAEFRVRSTEEALFLKPARIRLGKLGIPVRWAGYAYPRPAAGMQNSSGGGVRFNGKEIVIPYALLNEPIPGFISLTEIRAVSGGIMLAITVDTESGSELTDLVTPLIKTHLPAIRSAVGDLPEGSPEKARIQTALNSLDLLSANRGQIPVPEKPSGFISFLTGDVSAEHDGAVFFPQIGDDLFSGSTVQTETASSAELILRDESIVKIAENTVFLLEELPGNTGESSAFGLSKGSLRAKVTKMITPESEFTVQTGSAVLGVRGTDLYVLRGPDDSVEISVLEGEAVFIPVSGPETVISENSQAAIPAAALTGPVEEVYRTSPLSAAETERIEREMIITTKPSDETEIRRSSRVLELIEQVKNVASAVMAMDEAAREQLAREVKTRIDMREVDRQFRQLMEDPRFAELMRSLGIEKIEL